MTQLLETYSTDQHKLSNNSSGNVLDEIYLNAFSQSGEKINQILNKGFSVSNSISYFPTLPCSQITNLYSSPVVISGVEEYIVENFESYLEGTMTINEYYDLCKLADDIFKDGLPEDEIKF